MLRYRIDHPKNKWELLLESIDNKQLPSDIENSNQLINSIVEKFAVQLKLDEIIMNDSDSSEEVSDCGLSVPRRGNCLDTKYNIAKKISFLIFPVENDEKEQRIWSYIKYSQLISKLKAKFIAQLDLKENERKLSERQRISTLRRNFCTLSSRGPSESVKNPTPMPVEVSPLSELEGLFSHLKNNDPVIGKDYIQFTRGACYSDGRMDLCKQVVGSSWIESLMNSIKNNSHIKHFLLGNNIIDIRGASAIANFIVTSHKPKIETWYLAGNCIDSEGIKLIAKSLKTDNDAKTLWLKRNPINEIGAKYIGDMLKVNNSITCLDLHNTDIGDTGLMHLCEGLLENTSLKRLYLDANNISAIGVRYLHNYFCTMDSLGKVGIQSLWLGMNRLEEDGTYLLADAFTHYKHMERVCLNSNRINADAAKALCASLIDHKELILFDIGMYKSTGDMGELPNNLLDEGAEYIADFIKTNKYVKVLDISQNGITDTGIDSIINAMESNTTLCYIYYGQYGENISQDKKDKLYQCMERNTKIQYNMTFTEFRTTKLRFLKHTEDILKIDSIYRNKM